MKRYIFIIIFLLIVVVIGAKLIPTDKNRIQKVIDSSKAAVLNDDLSGFMENISFNYRDDYGNSYLLLKKRMEQILGRFSDFEMSTDIMSVDITDETAEVDVKVAVTAFEAGEKRDLLGDAAWPQDLRVSFEKASSLHWEIIKVERIDR